jgi:homoserine O-acetyltransferase
VTYLDIESTWGHDAFLLEVETMTKLLGSFLERLVREEKVVLPSPLPEPSRQETMKEVSL